MKNTQGFKLCKTILQESLIKFVYKTKDGSRRFASGTTNKAFIKKNFNLELNGEFSERDGLITYFDTDKKNWRSFIEKNLKDITHVYRIDEEGNFIYEHNKVLINE